MNSLGVNNFNIIKILYGSLFLALSLNLLFYVGTTANPYLRSDDWFFLSDFLVPFYSDNFGFSDLYVLRGAADHLQPMHRILFILNAVLFDLDLRYEAVLGALFAVALAWMMSLHFKRSHGITDLKKDIALGMLAVVALVFSLNSTITYTWSLPAIGFMPVFLNIGFFIYLSSCIVKNEGSGILLATFGLLVLFVGDDVSVLVMIVASLILVIAAFVQKQNHIWRYLLIIISVVIVYQLFKSYMISGHVGEGNKSAILNGIKYYIKNWDVIYKIVAAPFSDSLIHTTHLRKYPDVKEGVSLFLGYAIILLHLYTWYAFFKYKLYRASYLPVMLMLYSYALTAGIVIYRVPEFGVNYMHQIRYVRTYQIGLWGCAWGLLSLYTVKTATTSRVKLYRYILYATVLFVISIQIIHARQAWVGQKYNIAWQKQHAAKIAYYGGDKILGKPCPEVKPGYPFPICKMDQVKRETLVGFLKEKKLNVFSERIRQNYLY